MGEYINEQEQNFEERKEPTTRDIAKEVPFKYWFAIAILSIMVYVLYKQEQASIWHLIIVAIIFYFIFKSSTEVLDFRKQHTQGEAIMIVYKEINKQLRDKEISFPQGKLIMKGIANSVTYEKEDKHYCKEIRVPFEIVKSTGLKKEFVAILDPYQPYVLGVYETLKNYRGDEYPHLKYIIPAEYRIKQNFFKGRLW